MTRPLPLLGLRVFAEVGRLGSIKEAAEALGVTPGAVSQQIKLLEARLGTKLLSRGNREVRMTPAGTRLHAPLAAAFQEIDDAVGATLRHEPPRQSLTISTTASFAASWLVPRLGRFMARYPEIEVRVETSSRLVNLQREPVDVALRHGLGDYPGLHAEALLSLRLVPVASPALLRQGPPINRPQDCLRYPLLHDGDRSDWPLWLKAQGVSDPRARKGPSFTDDLLLVQAAAAGQGLALVRDIYIDQELQSQRLAVALDAPWPSPFAYYLVTRAALAQAQKYLALRDWLREEAAADAAIKAEPAPRMQA